MQKTFPLLAIAPVCAAALICAPAFKPSTQPHDPQQTMASPALANSRKRIAATLVSGPAVFEHAPSARNDGPQFIGRAGGMDVALTREGIALRVRSRNDANIAPSTLAIQVKGAGHLTWRGEDKAQGETNYFVGSNPAKWRTHVARFNRVETTEANGLTLAVYGSRGNSAAQPGQGIEYDVRLNSGIDPSRVRLKLSGARDVKIDRAGDLVMRVAGRELRMKAPAIYEQVSTSHTQRRKMTSSPHPRRSTASRSTPTRSRGMRPPRINTRGAANTRRVRPRAPQGSHSTRRRRTAKIPPLPVGGNSVKSGPSKNKPRASNRRESGHRINGGYVLEADGSIGFWIAKHDPNAALVIDPSIALTYASFLGGAGTDSINSMAIDSGGSVYVAGTTTSAATFPEAANGIAGNIRGASQLFVAKIAFANGIGSLQYLTFFGGSNSQAGGQVAVDANGNAAVLGATTSADYPVTDRSVPTQGLTSGKGNDLVVSEVDPTGSNLIFSTMFGGNGIESANATSGLPLNSSLNIPAAQGGIAFDAAGNIYVASDTTSTDLLTTPGAYQLAFGGKSASGGTPSDGFVAEFQSQSVAEGASDLLYCSYLGINSDSPVAIGGIAVDSATPPGVYIAGTTDNSVDGFPARLAFQSQYQGGSSDAFVMKMQLAGAGTNDLLYATLLGGSGTDEALGIAVDSQAPPNAYVVGATQSLTIPVTPVIAGPSTKLCQPVPTPPPGSPPIQNAFLAVIGWSPGQTASLQYFTYLGGSGQDAAESVTAPSPNSVYVSGTATSYNFAWHDNVQPFNGTADAFLAKLDTTQSGAASLKYVTPLAGTFVTPGASVTTVGNAVAADGQGNVYIAGATSAQNFPTALTSGGSINGFQPICGSCEQSSSQTDAFVAALRESTAAQPALSFNVGKISFGSAGVQIGTPAVPQGFAILNTGDAPLNFSTTNPPAVTGANSGDFTLLLASGADCPQPLQPGQVCQAELKFVPSAAGLEGAAVSITDDAPGSPQLLEITGTGVGPLTVSPASFAFGSIPVNTRRTIEVTVTAGANIDHFNVPTIPEAPEFQLMPQQLDVCPADTTLQQGSSCDISYAFAPTATGSFQANLNITGEVNGAPVAVNLPLTGTAVPAAPVAIVLPGTLSFQATVGSLETLPVVVSNTGTTPLQFSFPLEFSGPDQSDFSETHNCPLSLPVANPQDESASSCTVQVTFAPHTAGNKIASLLIADNAPGSPQLVALSGTAIPPATKPEAQLSSASLDLGSVAIGTQSGPSTLTLTNAGDATLTFTQPIAITGANAADFTQTSNCAIGVAAGSSCTISVKFSPASVGAETALLSVYDNASGSPQTVALTGVGAGAPQAQLSVNSLDFGDQPVGKQSAPQTIAVTSVGTGQPLIITGLKTNGPDFAESDTCGGPITTSCSINVTFTPVCANEPAARSATLTIEDNGSVPTQTVALTGTATGDFCVSSSPDSLIETVAAGATAVFPPASSPPISIISVGSFSGTVNFACSSNPLGPACTITPAAAIAISPNIPAQIQIQASTSISSTAGIVRPTAGNRTRNWTENPTKNWPEIENWTGNWRTQLLWLPIVLIVLSLCLKIAGVEWRISLAGCEPSANGRARVPAPPQAQHTNKALAPEATLLPFSATGVAAKAASGLRSTRIAAGWRVRKQYRWIMAGTVFAAICLALASCGGGGAAAPSASSDPPPPLAGAYTLTVTATPSDSGPPQTLTLHLTVTP